MKIFFDTSSLVKLYHKEDGTKELEDMFSKAKISHVFLSEITKIEFTSTIWKKVRTKELNSTQANQTLLLFEKDFNKYNFITTDSIVLEQARFLTSKYGQDGLRSLDSIQLSTCLVLKEIADVYVTSDKLLESFFESEGLPTKLPE